MRILAVETSCDETAAAVVDDGVTVLSNIVASSHEIHKKYGGIVPELAAREQLRCIMPVIKEALEPFIPKPDPARTVLDLIANHIDALAVTVGPGLIGSLLVGVETVKTIAAVTNKPALPVNHVLAHMYANFIKGKSDAAPHGESPSFPAISLVVSGGHTELYLMHSIATLVWIGGTLDDAAGEAFDKTARLLGFENGGGVAIEKSARQRANKDFPIQKFPRPVMHDGTFNFSFSGLKTAVSRQWSTVKIHDQRAARAFAHEIQEAITDVLVEKTYRAAKTYRAKSILISGGVAANTRLREKFSEKIRADGISLHIPPIPLCTDNAAYIASYAFFRGKSVPWQSITALPDFSAESCDVLPESSPLQLPTGNTLPDSS